jgi:hypothetical protein
MLPERKRLSGHWFDGMGRALLRYALEDKRSDE